MDPATNGPIPNGVPPERMVFIHHLIPRGGLEFHEFEAVTAWIDAAHFASDTP
jgi:hypothetical protein